MSKTDKTRPWWVRLADQPMITSKPRHDHRHGPCTLPDELTRDTVALDRHRTGCHWSSSPLYIIGNLTRGGFLEWSAYCRETRRRSRRQARRELRAYLAEVRAGQD